MAWALRRAGEGWTTIGLDWSWFGRRKRWLIAGAGLLVAGVLLVSALALPIERQGLFPLQALGLAERLFMILGAVVTASVVEEAVFRGFAITRLGRLLGSPWRALPLSVASFYFLHGTPTDPGRIASLLIAGVVLGATFILLRCRRLEVLIVVHGLINLPLVLLF